jgi:hypothetical protein
VHGAEKAADFVTLSRNAETQAITFENNRPGVFTESNINKYYITIADHDNYVIPSSYEDINSEQHSYNAGTGAVAAAGGVGVGGENVSYDVREFPFIMVGNKRIDKFDSVLVDYYVARTEGATQIEITADKFGGNYYLEAETLFRN